MTPSQLILKWVDRFNAKDASGLAALYTEDSINHQVPKGEFHGRDRIREMFAEEFARFDMECIIENLFEDGEWAILEWRDPKGLRGCGFFHIPNSLIKFQRGYWDKESFLRQ